MAQRTASGAERGMMGLLQIDGKQTDFATQVAANFGEVLTPDRPALLAECGAASVPESLPDGIAPPKLSTLGLQTISTIAKVDLIASKLGVARDTGIALLTDVVMFSDQWEVRARALHHLLVVEENLAVKICADRVALDRSLPMSGICQTIDIVQGFSGLPFSHVKARALVQQFVLDEQDPLRAGGSKVALDALTILKSYGPVALPYAIAVLNQSELQDVRSFTTGMIKGWSAAPGCLVGAVVEASYHHPPHASTDNWAEIGRWKGDAELGKSCRKALRTALAACERFEAESPLDHDNPRNPVTAAKTLAKIVLRNLPDKLSTWILRGVRDRFPLAVFDLEAGAIYDAAKKSDAPVASNRGRFVTAHTAAVTVVELLRWHPGALLDIFPGFEKVGDFSKLDLTTKVGREGLAVTLRDHFITLNGMNAIQFVLRQTFGQDRFVDHALKEIQVFGRKEERAVTYANITRRVKEALGTVGSDPVRP